MSIGVTLRVDGLGFRQLAIYARVVRGRHADRQSGRHHLRALRIMREVNLIACEDTRQTQKLLNHYEISTPTISYHDHNEMTRAPELIVRMEEGESVALVTDAGMPGISDPGYRLIALAIRHHIPVVPIPGASAFLSALVASGLPGETFALEDFSRLKPGSVAKH